MLTITVMLLMFVLREKITLSSLKKTNGYEIT